MNESSCVCEMENHEILGADANKFKNNLALIDYVVLNIKQ